MRTALALLPLLLLIGCGSDKKEPEVAYIAAPLGQEYLVGFGETIRVGNNLLLEFTTLAEDSRCPASVSCVWEGNVRILVTATKGKTSAVLELNNNSRFPTSATFEGYVIQLRNVDPYPATPVYPRPQDYTVTLFVDVAPN